MALARSLVVEPEILLLDEPLSNLDAKLRERMRGELKQLQRRTGITFVYVTHDQAEALALSDRIAVIHGGRLQQFGTPREVYARPASRVVADFMGLVNLLPATVIAAGDGRGRAAARGGLDTGGRRARRVAPGQAVEVGDQAGKHSPAAARARGTAAAPSSQGDRKHLPRQHRRLSCRRWRTARCCACRRIRSSSSPSATTVAVRIDAEPVHRVRGAGAADAATGARTEEQAHEQTRSPAGSTGPKRATCASSSGRRLPRAEARQGTVLFVHGSSMASQPTFDLQVPGRPDSSVMDWFARRGFDTWCVDMEGYGRSDKTRDINFDIANGADDLAAASEYILERPAARAAARLRHLLGRAARRAVRRAAPRAGQAAGARRLRVDRRGQPDAGRAQEEARPSSRPGTAAPIDKAFVYSIFNRDHPGTAEDKVIEAFADAILALDDSVPTGTYVDMCSRLPVVDPAKITMPTIVMRGQWDGIASVDDLVAFFRRLPNPDKQFAVMPGISHASFQQKNYLLVYHILHGFFSQPAPLYRG